MISVRIRERLWVSGLTVRTVPVRFSPQKGEAEVHILRKGSYLYYSKAGSVVRKSASMSILKAATSECKAVS